MSTLVYVLIFVGIWVALNAWILPKFGIRT
jgi:hypothetical protein